MFKLTERQAQDLEDFNRKIPPELLGLPLGERLQRRRTRRV